MTRRANYWLTALFHLLAFSLLKHLLAPSWALHASEAGVVDWHKPLIGIPLTSAPSAAPSFFRLEKSDRTTHSLIITATASNVLAALDPLDGSIAWRYKFDEDEDVLAYRGENDVVAAVSGSGGAMLRLFNASNGHLLLEKRLHKPEAGRLFEPETLATAIAFDVNDVFVLSNAYILRRIDGKTGDVVWSWMSPDQSSLVAYSRIVATPSIIYIIGLAKSFASYTIHVTALSSSTGEVIASVPIPSSVHNGLTDFFAISSGTESRVIWLEAGVIKSLSFMPELKEKPRDMSRTLYKSIKEIALSAHGLFIAIKETESASIIRLDKKGLQEIWEFTDSSPSKEYTDSQYTGGLDKNGRPYVARVYWSHTLKVASAHVYAPHLAEGKGLVSGYTFPFETDQHGVITHVAVDLANPEEFKVIARLAVTTSTGAVQLWHHDQLQWIREEGLADIKVAELVELPERKAIAAHIREENETFVDRLIRQLSEAQDFPEYAVNFARRFVTGSYASVSSSVAPLANASEPLSRDTFGFRKVIIAATPYGKLYGIDSANGEILWSRIFGLGWATQIGGQIIPVKMFTTRTVNDGDTPQVVLITQRKASNSLVDTVLFHVDALTGEDIRGLSPAPGVLQGFDAIAGPLVEAFMLRAGSKRIIALLDEFVQVRLYPSTEESAEALKEMLPHLHIPLRTGTPGQRIITGHQLSPEPEFTGFHIAYPTWTLMLPNNEEILSIIPRTPDTVASLGKVLGNRTTLYKYLNPNMMTVATRSTDRQERRCSIYVVDGAKGTVLYHVVIPATDDVKVAFAENWLVYEYYDGDIAGVDAAKSYHLVSVELYEGHGADDKRRSSDLSSLSADTIAITAFEQAYVLPHGIRTISTTSTTYGITMKDIIVANENNQIQSFPRRALDPRRPKHKPTNQELEEMLVQYDALLPDDPKHVLSHNYEVMGTKRIITSPALLESTSLVFTYGQDLFFTRVAPSNTFDVLSENFNKAQLVLTVAGLAFAIAVAKPMVRRKRLREKWYDQ
ncbi:DUF1620-domain-containing protein [Laetiporus sulphureus 93-53]|uniref:ER membrane protein complex subunit 1 n=1 Tax=Laetiporus sulphureus 93-53 TaxID=1314785 RepID=A0A165FHP9_9APHY|nr:DUF1620-domain-containing protein [Laetiporus sulphureus 93-53]KZT08987.1 DUF1620-domain-containing protein [Laetiporus sulphureus 93-53]